MSAAHPADSAPMACWLAHDLDDAVGASLARLRRAGDVCRVAVMPDVHLSHDVCVGVALATRRRLYPAAVGGDIGCGMATHRFPGAAQALDEPDVATRVLDALGRLVPIRSQPRAAWSSLDPALFEPDALSDRSLRALAHRDGRRQLGTLGRGNHFLELQADDTGDLWATVHSGSRAMGPAIGRWYRARGETDPATGLRWVDAEAPMGRAYLHDMRWATRYATLSRSLMLDAVIAIMAHLGWAAGADEGDAFECTHNAIWHEDHGDGPVWVHRKGAVPAAAGQWAIIPGSMGAASYHVTGRGHPEALASASHGAGRAMSRSEARARISARRLSQQMRGVHFAEARAAALVEEAPAAYKDISAVMRAQRPLVRIVRRLRPVLNYKGG